MKPQFCFPCNVPFVVSQKFGENYDYYFTNFNEKGHNGWDFAVPVGTPIYSSHDGVVSFCKVDNFDSMSISIHTTDELYRTVYGHLSAFKVKLGDIVKKGQLIGLSGNTGRYTTGPHLHYGVHGILNGLDTNVDNGFIGALDPALFWDSTYPKDYVKSSIPQHVTDFIKALTIFQEAEGITPYPIIGKKTTASLKKYNLI